MCSPRTPSRLMPRDAHVLDVGTGDGLIAAALAERRPDLRIEGIDVLVRPEDGDCR